jgi:hypothetical protein
MSSQIAAAACGDAHQYAIALANLESLRTPSLALAATDGDLLARTRRLLRVTHSTPPRRSLLAAILVLACISIPLIALAQSAKPAPARAPATAPASQPNLRTIEIVIGRESIYHNGKWTDWIDVKRTLDAIPEAERKQTVLAVAAASPQVTVHQFFTGSSYAAHLVDLWGLAYLSETGIKETPEPPMTDQQRKERQERYRADMERQLNQMNRGSLPATQPAAAATQPSAISAPGTYYMGDDFVRSGAYDVDPAHPITLRQAITDAGGLNDGVEHPQISVLRRDATGSRYVLEKIGLDDVMQKDEFNIDLRANDVVRVMRPQNPPQTRPAATQAAAPPLERLLEIRSKTNGHILQYSDRLGSEHPTMVRLRKQLDIVDRKLAQELGVSDTATTRSGGIRHETLERIAQADATMREYLRTRDAMEFNLAKLRGSMGPASRTVRDAEIDLELQNKRIDTYARHWLKIFVPARKL